MTPLPYQIDRWRRTLDFLTRIQKDPALFFTSKPSKSLPFNSTLKKNSLGKTMKASEHAIFLLGQVANCFNELHRYLQFLQKIKQDHEMSLDAQEPALNRPLHHLLGDTPEHQQVMKSWVDLEEMILFLEDFQESYADSVHANNLLSFPENPVSTEHSCGPLPSHALAYLAYHDPLTGLANRQLFCQRLKQALIDSQSDTLGILFLDLDGFKKVNDCYGHEAGDC